MTNFLTLESPQELLRIKREYILQEIAVYGERERDNERLRENNDKLRWKVEKTRYIVNNRMTSFKNSLNKEPDKTKQAQLNLCRDIQGELR